MWSFFTSHFFWVMNDRLIVLFSKNGKKKIVSSVEIIVCTKKHRLEIWNSCERWLSKEREHLTILAFILHHSLFFCYESYATYFSNVCYWMAFIAEFFYVLLAKYILCSSSFLLCVNVLLKIQICERRMDLTTP